MLTKRGLRQWVGEPLPETLVDNSLSVTLAGDITLNKGVGDAITKRGHTAVTGIGEWIKADLVLGNLETPLVDRARPAHPIGRMMSRQEHAFVLRDMGFDAMNLANNHILDCGPEGLAETQACLSELGISYLGAGGDLDEALAACVKDVRGRRVGIIGFSQVERNRAEGGRPGVAPLDEDLVLQAVRALRPTVDILILSLHEGFEFSHYPRPDFMRMCRAFVNAGVDVVYGHHPHVIQGAEVYQGRVIFYSLGNFWFDLARGPQWARQGIAVRVAFHEDRPVCFDALPVVVKEDCSLRAAPDKQAVDMDRFFRMISRSLSDESLVVQKNRKFLDSVMADMFAWVYGMGREDDRSMFEFFVREQIRTDPFVKAFGDYARYVGCGRSVRRGWPDGPQEIADVSDLNRQGCER